MNPESELKRELRLSEERFRLLVEQAPEAIVVSDFALRRIADANRKALELFGCSKEELLQGGPERFYPPNQPDGAQIAESMKEHNLRALSGEEVVFERLVRSRTGKETHCEVRLSRLPSRNGTLLRASFIDITLRNRAKEEIRLAKEAAEAAHRAKSEFLDIAAHELRTPLTSLSLTLQLAQKQARSGVPPEESLLDRAVRQALRLNHLISDLLDVSRLERGGLELRPVVLDLNGLISEIVDDFRRLAPDREFRWAGPPHSLIAKADPARVHQILGNLLENAVKYSPPGSPVTVSASPIQGRIRIEVTDQGSGIPEAEQALLFRQFVRGSAAADRAGLGLGLYVSRLIAELHGGSLNVRSTPGEGSTFCFELPAVS